MTVDTLKRRVSRGAVSPFLGAIQLLAMSALFFGDRVFLAAMAAWCVLIGALQLFETNVRAAFYLSWCGTFAAFAYFCWTNPEVFSSGISIAFVAVQVGLAVGLFLFQRDAIHHRVRAC